MAVPQAGSCSWALNPTLNLAVSTPDWICLGASRVAPEVLSGVQYSPKADVFSFGVVLWELVTQVHLFPPLTACSSRLHPLRIQVCDGHKRADSKASGHRNGLRAAPTEL